MCLGIPGRVISLLDGYEGQLALVDVSGAERKVNIGMLDERLDAGDWVLIHMGFAVEKVTPEGARAALEGLELVGRSDPGIEARSDAGMPPTRIRVRHAIRGLVQGVGFRPFVYATASALHLSGSVVNTSNGVIAEVEGEAEAVGRFGERLRSDAPPLAVIDSVESTPIACIGGTDFVIGDSAVAGGSRTLASPDVATCADCLRELADPANRRYRHPFITCTNCGPRFTIITDLPYDRATTTMAGFGMCARCAGEYADPRDRRFHAQPIACPDCGPRLRYVDSVGTVDSDADAIAIARYRLAGGSIIAVKGIGGYHLVCDASHASAVAELRQRKQRGNKPFAVMVADLDAARAIVEMGDAEERLLTDPRRPIVLLRRRVAPIPALVCGEVAPDTDELGVMLAYSPVHVLLLGLAGDPDGPPVLVMTSGNRGGEPIVTADDDALSRLAPLVDGWLMHDRPIHQPCDDSVARIVDGIELPIRRSRGYAPMPLALPFEVEPALAVGADLKNTCAVASGRQIWLSQHVGDMDDLATVQAFAAAEHHLELLTGVTPKRIAADAHPAYRSSGWARRHHGDRPIADVQHHHAHIASVMGEHGLGLDARVIGVAFDGTGYGPDGAIWGGEVLLADYKGFERLAHLAYVPLAGGDASVERPYRMALAHLYAAGVAWAPDIPAVEACPDAERRVLARQFETGFGCVPTSSMGRLFDAVASLIGVRHTSDYEAQAAMMLESVAGAAGAEAGPSPRPARYPIEIRADGSADAAGLIRAIVDDSRRGVPVALIASAFHDAIADLVVELADRARGRLDESRQPTVVLGGGVFQNARLLSQTTSGLLAAGYEVLRPTRLPPNDGGIALGQLLVASTS